MRKIVALALLTLAVSVAAQNAEDRLAIDSKIMGESRTIIVHVPASYQTGARRYPVLYLTDGDAHIGHTAATAAYLAREGRMPEVILVGVVNTDRTRDLTPTKVADRPETGGADRFLDFFEKELIPTIESRYRTQQFRVFAGHSLGGLFALHALFTRPELFDAWIAVSPSLHWDNRYLFRRAEDFFAKPKRPATNLIVTIGDEGDESRTNFDDFKKLVTRRKPKTLDALFVHLPDEDHGSVVMPSHYAALRKVFAPWRFALAEGADPKTELMRANEHFAKLSARLGETIVVPENLMNLIGYRLMQANRNAEAIAVFQTNAKNWPQSANVYDSLGEAYEKAGQRVEARASYERAAQVGAETNDPNLPIFRRNAERLR